MSAIPRGAFALLATLFVGGTVLVSVDQEEENAVEQKLLSINAEALQQIDFSTHQQFTKHAQGKTEDYINARKQLRAIMEAHHEVNRIYTARTDVQRPRVLVSAHEAIHINRERPAHKAYQTTDHAVIPLNQLRQSSWISAVSRVSPSMVLVTEHRATKLVEAKSKRWRQLFLGSLLLSALFAILPFKAIRGGRKALRDEVRSLATRIGLAGTVAVFVAVTVVTWIAQIQGREDLLRSESERLLAEARMGASRVNGDEHEKIRTSKDAQSTTFQKIRDELRLFKDQAGLQSHIYSFRRVSPTEVQFVIMTNDSPFVGHKYPLREELERTFDAGEPTSFGPYTDKNGTWMSAVAPIRKSDGSIIGVLQVDRDWSLVQGRLHRENLERLSTAIIGLLAAFIAATVIARSIAKPIHQVAEAAAAVANGNLTVMVDEGGATEVDRLAKSINRMIRGLLERQRIHEAMNKYIGSSMVAELLNKDELTLHGEARKITVLLSDIRGYTALAESLGANEVVALLNEYFGIMMSEVIAQGGHIDKFMGDAMLCWFGAPIEHEDHHQRAVQAAVSMAQALNLWNKDRAAEGLPAIKMGIGVATGEVIIGNIGNVSQKLEYTAIGDAVNLASRLCSLAKEDELLVSSEVYKNTTGFDFEDAGSFTIKGVAGAVHLFRATFKSS